jgi:hypothetical protein
MMIQLLGKLQDWISIIKQVYPNKSSLLLNIDLQSTQTLQLWKSFTKVIERPSKEAWVWIDRVSN